ncbi:MAG: DUF3048 domain-containing protein [Microgenomates group bacterium]|nr:DUF3048 domain-containing protein [Microgenomates group bacterium]
MISKKIAIIIGAIIFLMSSYTSYKVFSSTGTGMIVSPLSKYFPPKNGSGSPTPTPDEPKTEECPLNGQMMTKSQKNLWVNRRPLGIVVENHKDARPQSGLSFADVIYEGVAESGITRFLAIYYCQDANPVGPVRSARVHFINLLQEYGDYPLYAHVGGANTPGPADALGYINKLGWSLYNDLNQFAVPFPFFWRDYERLPNRVTEHTVYTSTSKLWDYAKNKRKLTNVDEDNQSWDANFTSWKFADDASLTDRGNVNQISFGFWTTFANDYSVVWTYNKNTNLYTRQNGGQPHLDKNTNQPIQAKDIIVIFAKESPANDGYEGGHIVYKLTGSGEALIFQNGKAIKGSWQKKDYKTRMLFFDESGKEISLVRGKIFIELLPQGNKINY